MHFTRVTNRQNSVRIDKTLFFIDKKMACIVNFISEFRVHFEINIVE